MTILGYIGLGIIVAFCLVVFICMAVDCGVFDDDASAPNKR